MSITAEYWDLYDRQMNKLNETIRRGTPIPNGKYHLVCEIATIDSKGRILLTKRHPKKHYPLYWECSGGSVVAGEIPIDGAVRELFEETGIKADKSELVDLGITYGNRAIYCNYLLRRDIDISSLVLQSEEVVDARLVAKDEFEQMAARNEIVPLVVGRLAELGIDRLLK